jgi:hypothetical protein
MREYRNTLSTKAKNVLILLTLLAIATVSIILIVQQIEESKKQVPESYVSLGASWEGLPGGDSEKSAIENSSVIGKGTVVNQTTEVRGIEGSELVFTISSVIISEVFAVGIDEVTGIENESIGNKLKVNILQTGGTYGDIMTPEIEDAPLLIKGKSYLLFLEKTEEGYYLPVGGRLGVAEITKGEVSFVNEESSEMFDDFEGEKVSDVTDTLGEFATEEEIEDSIYVNVDEYDPVEALEEAKNENEAQ